MTKNDVPVAKVYVWKDAELGEKGKPWKIGWKGWADEVVIVFDGLTFEEAWQYLYENYRREAP